MEILLWALGAIIVWCIFWWVVGPIIYYTKVRHDDVWHIYVPYAPLMPIAFVGCLLDDKSYELKKYLFIQTARKIATKLQEKGIEVTHYGYSPLGESCEVITNLKPGQVEDFRSVYAWAIKKFKGYTPTQLCHGAQPLEYLDKEWAKKIGITEYSAKRYSVPCKQCGERALWGDWWGDDKSHAEPWSVYGKVDCSLVSKSVGTVEGLCRSCVDELIAAG